MGYYYVVIAESKVEEPLIHETYLHDAGRMMAYQRMKALSLDAKYIRVAVGRVEYCEGNKCLFDGGTVEVE